MLGGLVSECIGEYTLRMSDTPGLQFFYLPLKMTNQEPQKVMVLFVIKIGQSQAFDSKIATALVLFV